MKEREKVQRDYETPHPGSYVFDIVHLLEHSLSTQSRGAWIIIEFHQKVYDACHNLV